VYFDYENDADQSLNISDDQLGRGYANIPRNVIQQLGLSREELPPRIARISARLDF
jgi:hypothetical protein